MRSFRYVVITMLLTLGTFSLVVYTSCNKDKCGSTTCNNGGTCDGSTCVCPIGYSGSSCSTGWSDACIGTYDCMRANCSPAVTGLNSWKSAVTKDATNGGYTIDISDFDNSNTTIVATIDSAQNIIVSPAVGSYGVSAKGTYVNGRINLKFTTSSVGGVGGYTCNMVMTKE